MACGECLCRPEFLFRLESIRLYRAKHHYRLTASSLASRLLFFCFLWSSIPDAELLDWARAVRSHA